MSSMSRIGRLLAVAGALAASSAMAQSPNVVISSAYGGGGFNVGTPLNDYVELFNRSTSPVSLDGWSVQIGTGTSTVTWNVIPLSGTIAAGGYYLVAVGIPFDVDDGDPLPTPDASASPLLDTSALTSPSGRIALANVATPFGVACPVGQPEVVDFLGYGSVTCFEGTGAAPGGVSGSQMTFRKNAGCVDSDNNSLDFEQGWPPTPRNSATPAIVGGVFVTTVPSPATVNVGGSTLLSTTITGCAGSAPTITGVTADLSAFGLSSAVPLTESAGTWTYSLSVPLAQPAGLYTVNITATDGTTSYPGTTTFRVIPPAPSNDTCASATVIGTLPFDILVDNAGATSDIDPGTCNTGTVGNSGVWYVYTPTTAGVVTVTETSTQNIASGVWIAAAPPNGAADCAGFVDGGGTCLGGETFSFSVVPGNSYYIQIGNSPATLPDAPITATVTFSTAPINDECANATPITGLTPGVPQPFATGNLAATADIDPGTCNTGTAGNFAVWYRYDATQDGVLLLDETSTQTVAYGVWATPTAGASCPFAGPASLCSTTQSQPVAVLAGNTYFIQIGASSTTAPTVAAEGSFTFTPTTGNDNCTGATLITGLTPGVPQPFTADNLAATADIDPGTCNTGNQGNFGVWFRYDATAPGVLVIDETSTQTVAYGIWSTPTSGATCPIAGPATTCSTTQSQVIAVVPGTTYFIQIGSSGTAAPTVAPGGTFTFLEAPANDDCASATPITGLTAGVPQAFTADNRAATPDLDPGTCNSGTQGNFGVWFRYDATVAGALQLTETSTQTVAWGVWETPTSGAACPSTSPATLCTTTQNTSIVVVPGNTYYIQIGASGTAAPTVAAAGTFTLVTPPANDECADATTLTGTGFFPIGNLGAATGAAPLNSVPCPTTASAMNNDVWYRWVAPASGSYAMITRQHPAPFTGRIAIYDGGTGGDCPTAASPIRCASIGTALSNDPLAPLTATAGNVYLIQVASSTAGATGVASLEIVQNPDPVGACCAGSACTIASSFACAALGGTYQGDGTFCSGPTGSESVYGGSPGAIPDGSTTAPGVYSNTITVPDGFTVDDVEVVVDLNHTWQGDVFISLTKGDRTLVLVHRGRRGMSSAGVTTADYAGAYTFTDGATQSIFDYVATGAATPIPVGSYRPASVANIGAGFRKTFNGVNSAGDWTLLVQDEAASDTGTVNGWTLRLRQGTTGPCASTPLVCCRGVTCTTVAASGDCTAPAGVGVRVLAPSQTSCTGQAASNAGCCYADFNKSNVKDVADIFAYLSAWFANSPFADVGGDGTGTRDVADIFSFLSAWFAGCN